MEKSRAVVAVRNRYVNFVVVVVVVEWYRRDSDFASSSSSSSAALASARRRSRNPNPSPLLLPAADRVPSHPPSSLQNPITLPGQPLHPPLLPIIDILGRQPLPTMSATHPTKGK